MEHRRQGDIRTPHLDRLLAQPFIATDRKSATCVVARTTADAAQEPGPFRLSCLLERNGVTASLLAYPDDTGDAGYFLLLAGLPAAARGERDAPVIKREVTMVIDRSAA